MNRRTPLFLMSLLAGNLTYANSFYTGVNLGINSTTINKNLVYPLAQAPISNFNYNSSYNNFHGRFFIGKEFSVLNRWSLALQGDGALFTGTTKNNISNWFLENEAKAREKLKYGIGLFILPEYQFRDDFKIYAGPGWVYSKLSTTSNYTAGNLGVTGNFNNWLSGWSIKIGTVNKLSDTCDFLLTYQYDEYNSLTRTRIEPLSENSLRGTYKPRANLFTIGIKYKISTNLSSYEK